MCNRYILDLHVEYKLDESNSNKEGQVKLLAIFCQNIFLAFYVLKHPLFVFLYLSVCPPTPNRANR